MREATYIRKEDNFVDDSACKHHWLIGTGKPIAVGKCKLCDATKTFVTIPMYKTRKDEIAVPYVFATLEAQERNARG